MEDVVCKHFKFGFCKTRVGTNIWKIIAKIWNNVIKEICNKRHPRLCRKFAVNNFCKHGTACTYHHQTKSVIEEKLSKDVINQLNDLAKKVIKMQSKINILENELSELKTNQEEVKDMVKEPNNEIDLWLYCEHCDYRCKRESTVKKHTNIKHDEQVCKSVI